VEFERKDWFMSQVIEILKSLGINETLFFQFGIFSIAYLSMNFIVFRPYLRAYNERVRRTLGSQKETQEILQQADQKEQEYKILVKKLNRVIKSIFHKLKMEAEKDSEKILLQAKKDSELQSKDLSEQLELSVAKARKDLKDHIPDVSNEIQRKFMEC